MYILIVEDDPFLSYDIKDALLGLHPDIREASSVDAAMLILDHGAPGLALLDYNLKTGTSAVVAARLARERIPFGYVTADGDGVRGDPAIPDCPIVAKPYRIEDVTRMASALMAADRPLTFR